MVDAAAAARGDGSIGEAALRALVEHAPDGVFVSDMAGTYSYVNLAGCRMLGYSRDELIGTSMLDHLAPGDVDRLMRAKAAMINGSSDVGEWMLRRKDGTWLPVEVHANILPGGQWQGFVRDISERKAHLAEREALFHHIQTERRWLQTVMDTLPLGILLYEQDGTVSANRRAEEILGLKVAPELGPAQYAGRIMYPDGKPVPPTDIISARVKRGETIIGAEYVVHQEDGTRVPILGSAAPIFDDSGVVIGGVGVFQDVGEHMRLQQKAHESEQLLQAVFDILPVGVWLADRSGRLFSHNPAAQRIWGGVRYVSVAEFGEYKGWWVDSGELIAPEEWGMARALAHGETSLNELIRIECFDGTFKTIIHSAAPLRDDSGQIIGAVVVNEDITALYDAQEKQRASEQLFRTVFNLLPVGLWISDGKGHITLGNPAGERIWGGIRHVGPQEFDTYEGWWAETGKRIEPEEWGLSRAIQRGETSRSELIRIRCFDGSFKTVINWAAPIRDESGQITGAVAVNEDITALHQAQEQLRVAVRDREDILAVVTHDLRNPLSALMLMGMSAESQARSLPGGAQLRATAASIIDSARGMSALVDDLLAITVAKPGRSMLKVAPTRAGLLLSKAADAARPLFARKGIELETEIDASEELPSIEVDANRILRVLGNLLDNALKFTDRPGKAVLRAEAVSGSVRFCVANSGPPLAADALTSMFKPFWQAARDDGRGAGLGLSICRSIVEAHGGSIWADPAPGMRVRICFLLPCVSPAIPHPLVVKPSTPRPEPPAVRGAE